MQGSSNVDAVHFINVRIIIIIIIIGVTATIIMRPSSLGGGRILCRTLSVCPSVRPSRYERHVAPPSELQ